MRLLGQRQRIYYIQHKKQDEHQNVGVSVSCLPPLLQVPQGDAVDSDGWLLTWWVPLQLRNKFGESTVL